MNEQKCPTCSRPSDWNDKKCWWCGKDLPKFTCPQHEGMMSVTADFYADSSSVWRNRFDDPLRGTND